FCTGSTVALYDPAAKKIDAWPDDFWSIDDPVTATKRRLHVVPGENIDVPPGAMTFKKVFDDLSLLDGFGTTAQLFARFSGPIDEKTLPPSGDGSGGKDASVVVLDLDAD